MATTINVGGVNLYPPSSIPTAAAKAAASRILREERARPTGRSVPAAVVDHWRRMEAAASARPQ